MLSKFGNGRIGFKHRFICEEVSFPENSDIEGRGDKGQEEAHVLKGEEWTGAPSAVCSRRLLGGHGSDDRGGGLTITFRSNL
jgi:hypothetical protein